MPVVEFYSVMAIAMVGYLLPLGVALYFKHRRTRAIALVNILAGWTVVGWFLAMLMAFAEQPAGRAGPKDPGAPGDQQ
ncbi:hypothetical protein CKO28_12695 [Rhodovibrio sodomensis]|uniref:Superinfection immunity protein n=1 Tax=Rhodovibrio sodomensis TaxID=1088 RepID=A0ABS1DEL0_9PROT|nr:superinfection immunity protein [Rhodovibrio sodomensis]MBK1668889.1 hypothetical protein [Rhodovibrio sodomensis]